MCLFFSFLLVLRFDPWSLLNGFKNKALEMGVEFVRAETVGFETEEMIVSHKAGIADGSGYQKLKRVHVCFDIHEQL